MELTYDIIYTDSNKDDLGVVDDPTLDLEIGEDKNDFQLTVNSDNLIIEGKSYIYINDSEYGGIIDDVQETSNSKDLVYSGRTFQGILECKIIRPESGYDYYIVSGDANYVLGVLIDKLDLSDSFVAETESSGITINNYQFDRYINGYKGINKMLKKYNAKLKLRCTAGKVKLSAVSLVDYSQDEEWDKSQLKLTGKKKFIKTNHLVCLGQGELKERTVIDLYCDANGNISTTQTFFGVEELTKTYENVNCSTDDVLMEEGISKFEDLISDDEIDADFNNNVDDVYDIGDIVGTHLDIVNASVSEYITKKVLKISDNEVTVECEVG